VVGTEDAEQHVVYRGAPGWVRLTIGQRATGEDDLQVHVLAEPAADDEPTRVRRRGAWLADDLLETSDRIA